MNGNLWDSTTLAAWTKRRVVVIADNARYHHARLDRGFLVVPPGCRKAVGNLDAAERLALSGAMLLCLFGHQPNTLVQRSEWSVAEYLLHPIVAAECKLHLMPRFQMEYLLLAAHGVRDDISQFVDGAGRIPSNVEYLADGFRHRWGLGDGRHNVVNVAERAHLLTVAKNRHRQALENLVHEYPHHVPVAVSDILPRADDVVRAENHVVQPKHLAADCQFALHGCLGDPVGVFRCRGHVCRHGHLR